MVEKPELVGSRSIHQGRIVDLEVHHLRFSDGVEVEVEQVIHPGGAAVVALDGQGRVALVEQHRHAVDRVLLEVPAGKLNPGELPEVCAARELEEEIGMRPGRLVPLGAVWTTPGFSDERIWLYLADGLSVGEQKPDSDERLEVQWVPFEQALQAALSGKIQDAKSVCALIRADYLNNNGSLSPSGRDF